VDEYGKGRAKVVPVLDWLSRHEALSFAGLRAAPWGHVVGVEDTMHSYPRHWT